MERWSGKVALITGAGSGIGAAITEELVKHGLKVIGFDLQVDKVEELKKKLQGEKGELHPIKGNVTKEEDIYKAFEWIRNKFGTLHVLINNAGISRSGELLTMDLKHCNDIMHTNVLGPTVVTQQAFKLMQDSQVNDGHIFFMNSTAGHEVPHHPFRPSCNMYSPSKFAITSLVESLHRELKFFKTKIRITSISPGFTRTEIFRSSYLAVGREVIDIPDDFPALSPKDIANGVIFALSAPPGVQIRELTIIPTGGQ